MSFWSGLAKVLGAAGAGIAVPLTGGASLASLPAILGASAGALSGIGSVASGAAAGRAQGRVQEANINTNQDALRLQAARILEEALQSRAHLDLQQRQFGLRAPGLQASNAVRGDALAGLQDVGISGPITHTRGQIPEITGGLRPSLLSGNTRQLGQNLSRDALLQNMDGADTFSPLPPPQIPTITPSPQSNGFDTFLNIAGGTGAALGAVGPLLEAYRRRRASLEPPAPGPLLPIGNPSIPSFGGFGS